MRLSFSKIVPKCEVTILKGFLKIWVTVLKEYPKIKSTLPKPKDLLKLRLLYVKGEAMMSLS